MADRLGSEAGAVDGMAGCGGLRLVETARSTPQEWPPVQRWRQQHDAVAPRLRSLLTRTEGRLNELLVMGNVDQTSLVDWRDRFPQFQSVSRLGGPRERTSPGDARNGNPEDRAAYPTSSWGQAIVLSSPRSVLLMSGGDRMLRTNSGAAWLDRLKARDLGGLIVIGQHTMPPHVPPILANTGWAVFHKEQIETDGQTFWYVIAWHGPPNI